MLNQATLNEIAELSNDNDHGRALAIGARLLGKQVLADLLFDLTGQRDEAGYVTPTLRAQFDILASLLFNEAILELPREEYRRFKSAY